MKENEDLLLDEYMENENLLQDGDVVLSNIIIDCVKGFDFASWFLWSFGSEPIPNFNKEYTSEEVEKILNPLLGEYVENYLELCYSMFYECIEFFDLNFYFSDIKVIGDVMQFTYNIESKKYPEDIYRTTKQKLEVRIK